MVPDVMAQWAHKKGIDLLSTGDWTHPLWLKELETNLQETGEGIYKLKSQRFAPSFQLASSMQFILSTEISSIYSQGGKTRRIHNLVMASSFNTIHKINDELKRRGCNLLSDGRPIIGLSSMQLAELIWSIDKSVLIVPAHIWTPWFSMFGSKSGFDSLSECWGEFSDRIYAIETGLSSDPAMNWRIKELDNRAIVSFGDSHSPAKLGRELTVFDL
jgi:DNA helicase-2/ATP-dependent DNA helicase PcrA